MSKKIIALFIALAFSGIKLVKADEGMWLLLQILQNYETMKKEGLKLTPEQIYSINNSSMKDAIVRLGGGFCTAEMISGQGLLLTNHHCGFDAIQSHSSPEHDYLTDGFWAMSKNQELAVPGLTADYLVRMEDVSSRVLKNVNKGMSENERAQAIQKAIAAITEEVAKEGDYDIDIKDFYEGSEYYMFIYKIYKDVRLVGAPPSSVGKYGGDTDNWMWPRHTGDFSMFRVYSGKDNNPAEYSADNIPYKPAHHLPVSIKGVKQNDFAMIMGYPGSTDRYLSSFGVKDAVEVEQPERVKIRAKILELYKEDMDKSDKTRIMYASKYAKIANYWKYFIGQSEQLKNNHVYEKKKAEEKAYLDWANNESGDKAYYGNAVNEIGEAYEALKPYTIPDVYMNEAMFSGMSSNLLVFHLFPVLNQINEENTDNDTYKAMVAALIEEEITPHFKNFNAPTEEKVTAAMLEMFYNNVDKKFIPEYFNTLNKKYKGDWNKVSATLFAKSPFTNKERLITFLENPKKKLS